MTKEQISFEKRILTVGFIAMTLILLFAKFANAQKQGRIWSGSFPPTTPPSGFTTNADFWLDTVSAKTYQWNRAWRLSPVQIVGKDGAKGDRGEQGLPGAPGVCPDCPPASGGGGSSSWDVTTWSGLIAALDNDNIRTIELRADITAGGKWRIKPNYSRIKVINGNGYRITVPSNIDTFIVRTYNSLSEANAGIDMQLRISNVEFVGNGSNVCIAVQANYGAKIEGCRFYNFHTAYKGGWTMGTVIEQCYFWENYIGIDFDYARFSGGSNSASQSNHSIVRDCKFRNSAGDFACIKATAVSGLQILHNIFEGVENGGDYDVYFDDNSSNVVKEFLSYGNHHEHKARIAAYYVRLKDGYAQIGGVYSQYDQTLISFESSAYAKMIVSEIPYLTSGTKFENKNTAGRWAFINPPATFVNTDATRWIGAIPSFLAVDGWDTNGQRKYMQGTLIK